jgi:APA family basic amino acid/polyamine antiporter
LIAYLGYFCPVVESGLARAGVIAGLVVFLTIINIIGVRPSARVGDVLTVGKLVLFVLFVAVGMFFISPARLTLGPRPSLGQFSGAVFILVYAFSGFEAVLVNSGEIRQPQRVIPFALFSAMSAVVVLFLLIQVVCIGTLPQLATSERPLADASQRFVGTVGPAIVSAAALVSILGTLNAVMLALTRLPFAMALHGQLPSLLARVHTRFRTPHVSILVSAAAVLLLTLAGTFIYAVKVTVITRVIVYTSACLALPILRRRSKMIAGERTPPSFPAAFELPAGTWISILCVVLCLWLLANSGLSEVRDVAIAVAVGLTFYAATRVSQRKALPRLDGVHLTNG